MSTQFQSGVIMSLLSFTQVSSCAFSVSLRCHHVSSRFHSGVIMCLLNFTHVSSLFHSGVIMCLLSFSQVSSCVFSASVKSLLGFSQVSSCVLVSVRCHHVSTWCCVCDTPGCPPEHCFCGRDLSPLFFCKQCKYTCPESWLSLVQCKSTLYMWYMLMDVQAVNIVFMHQSLAV